MCYLGFQFHVHSGAQCSYIYIAPSLSLLFHEALCVSCLHLCFYASALRMHNSVNWTSIYFTIYSHLNAFETFYKC